LIFIITDRTYAVQGIHPPKSPATGGLTDILPLWTGGARGGSIIQVCNSYYWIKDIDYAFVIMHPKYLDR
jgi:hypothetical protein